MRLPDDSRAKLGARANAHSTCVSNLETATALRSPCCRRPIIPFTPALTDGELISSLRFSSSPSTSTIQMPISHTEAPNDHSGGAGFRHRRPEGVRNRDPRRPCIPGAGPDRGRGRGGTSAAPGTRWRVFSPVPHWEGSRPRLPSRSMDHRGVGDPRQGAEIA